MSNNGLEIKDIINIPESEIVTHIDAFIKSSLKIKDGIIKSNKIESCMLALLRDTYSFNIFHSYCGLMQIISNNKKIWEKVDEILSNYSGNFFKDINLYHKIVSMKNYYEKDKSDVIDIDKKDFVLFLNKFMNKFHIKNNVKGLDRSINVVENRIRDSLHSNPIVKISTKYLSKIPIDSEVIDNKINVSLSYENYCTLIDLIDNIEIRHQIEKVYMSKTRKIAADFAKIIELRHLYADANKFNTYFQYINRGKFDSSDTIKDLITELNNKINSKAVTEIDKIYKYFNRQENSPKLISLSDVIKYNRIHKNVTKFEPEHVIKIIFYYFDKYFNINVKLMKTPVWRNDVKVYLCSDKFTNKILGKLYIDIYNNSNKIIDSPLFIKLSDKMKIDDNIISTGEMSVIANYNNYPCMSYNDIIMLFREFGYVLQNLSYESKVGLLNYDDEFNNFVPQIMEYIAWDRHTIELITNSTNDTVIVDHIEMGRYIDMCISLKIRCINAKFDHMIHNSEPLLKIIKDISKNKEQVDEIIIKIYTDIFKEIMEPLANLLNINITDIDPLTIVQEIGESKGVLYSNLMNEIFAYSAFYIIKNNNKADFRKNVMENSLEPYRNLVRNFIETLNQNAFNLYVKDVLKIINISTIIDDCITEDTNYFDDKESDDESDIDQIIQFDKKIECINTFNDQKKISIKPKQINMNLNTKKY